MKAYIKNAKKSENVGKYRKDQLSREIVAIDPATGRPLVIARIYYPRATAFACIWLKGGNYARGGGKAGGGGYHKESAALGAAIRDAGVELSESISGHGQHAMTDAVEAIAKALAGKRKIYIHESYA